MHIKLFFPTLLLLFLFSLPQRSYADHIAGGEVTWECLSNGQYIFHLTIYRDCSGLVYPFGSKTIYVSGNPLPRNGNGVTISAISLYPDSAKYLSYNGGAIGLDCANSFSTLSCTNNDPGAYQAFFFRSNPIQLFGRIPTEGWSFSFITECCRPFLANLRTTGQFVLRASMYRSPMHDSTNLCYDSSPRFNTTPVSTICDGLRSIVNYSASDKDLDSLTYHWDRSLDPPLLAAVPALFESGFSYTNPTPDQSFDPSNYPSQLDSRNGLVELEVHNGRSNPNNYHTVVRVDSWRKGHRLASVLREIPITVIDCNKLSNDSLNNSPSVEVNGVVGNKYNLIVSAGQNINMPILIKDLDQGNGSQIFQRVKVLPFGNSFAVDYQDSTYCQRIGTSCAVLKNQDPTFNQNSSPPRYELTGLAGLSTEFKWQTGCNNIQDVSGPSGSNSSKHDFVFQIQDDHCSLPAHTVAVVSVTVKDPDKLQHPFLIGVTVNLDGSVSYQWVPPRDTAETFSRYYVEYSQPSNAVPPQHFLSIDTNERRYQQERGGNFIRVYNPNPQNPNENNILNPIQGKDFYLRMKTLSGCKQNQASSYSNLGRVMELDLQAIGQSPDPLYSRLELRWNAARGQNQAWNDNMISKSQTTYYIWQTNDLNNLDNQAVWQLRDSTYNTSLQIASSICNSTAAYRIEARDTVYTYRKTTSLNNDVYDTLYFSTFSMIDTIPAQLAKPRIQTVGLERLETDILATTYQWFDCATNQLIPNAGNRSYIPQKPGYFKVFIESDGCSDTSACFYVDSIVNGVDVIDNQTLQARSNQYQLQWIDCRLDTIIDGETGPRLNLQDTGYYALVSYAYGFSDTSECMPMLSVGIETRSKEIDQLVLYPNPTNGVIFFGKPLKTGLYAEVYDMNGQLILERELKPSVDRFEVPGEKGVYILKLTDQTGNRKIQRVIKI